MFFLQILITFLMIYSGFKFSMILISLFANLNLIVNPVVIIGLLVYGLCIYVGRAFFRSQKYGWYGIVILVTIVIMKDVFLATLVLVLRHSLPSTISIPTVWPGILELLIYGVIIRLAFSPKILEQFELNTDSKISLFTKVFGISSILTISYLIIILAST